MTQKQSATESLLEKFGQLIDSAAETMDEKEFENAEKKSSEILDHAIDAHSRRRETA